MSTPDAMRGALLEAGMERARRTLDSLRGTLVVLAIVAVACSQSIPPPTASPSASPGAPGALTPPAQRLIVSAAYVRQGSGGQVFAGQPVTVSAHALGESGVAALELWDGDQLVGAQAADPDSPKPAFYARWQWTPAESGLHTLFARAVDLRGGVAQSSAVRVQVVDSVVDTGSRWAVWPVAMVGPASHQAPERVHPAISYGIAAPNLEATLNGCQLGLVVRDAPQAAHGIQLVGLAPSGISFAPLTTLSPSAATQPQTVALAGGGTFLFVASAFDDSVVAFGAPVKVAAPDSCAGEGWSGAVSLLDGRLVAPQQVDRAYIYLTQGAGAAVRVPSDQGEFVELDGSGALDFGPLLPALDGSPMSIEAWGWQQHTLVKLGSGSYTPAPAPTPGGGSVTSGGPLTFGGGWLENSGGILTTLKVVNWAWGPKGPGCDQQGEFYYCPTEETSGFITRPAPASTTPITKTFHWTTALPSANQLVWQILPYPPPGSADLNPPFMIDHGVIPVTPGQFDGEFTLDFAKYFTNSVPMLDLGLAQGQQQTLSAAQVQLLAGLGGSATPAPTATPGSTTAGNQFAFAGVNPVPLAAFSDKFYVRLVPIEFNAASLPSGPVTLEVLEPTQIQITDPHAGEGWNQNAYTVKWTYEPPVAPDPAYTRCAIVKAVDKGAAGIAAPLYESYRISGKPLCYEPPDDDGWSPVDVFDAFVEFVSGVWDWVSDGYDWIQDKVVEAVVALTQCETLADQFAEDGEEACRKIAKTGLQAVMVSFGIPPSLPKWDEQVALYKGDLRNYIVGQIKQQFPEIAVACDAAEAADAINGKAPTCDELVDEAVDEAMGYIEQQRSEAAGKASGWYNPGVTFEPDPRGMWHPAEFKVTLTRTTDQVLPKTCWLSAGMKSTVKNWKFTELWNGYPKSAVADVSGSPLGSAAMIIPPLAPGESMTRELYLTEPTIWFESQRAEWYWKYYEALNTELVGFSRAWVLLTTGAQLMFSVNSNCAMPSEQGPYTLPKSAYDN